jgi:hypothetical protein
VLYVPEPVAAAEYEPWVVPSGQVSTVLVTVVAPGVAFPNRYSFVIPTVGLEGDKDPVSVAASQAPPKKSRRIDDREKCRRSPCLLASTDDLPVFATSRVR